MPVEGRGLSSRQTQQAVRDRGIGQPNNSETCSEAAEGVTRKSEGGSVRRLKEAVDRRGWTTKRCATSAGRMRGGRPISRGHLYRILSNPLYIGQIAHKGELHPGQHEALIENDTWAAVEAQFAANTAGHRRRVGASAPSLLPGLLGG